MFIFVKTLTGKTLSLDVDPSDSIAAIKNKIESQTSVPASQQKILFAGKELTDDNTLSSYNVQKESMLHLILKEAVKKEVKMEKPHSKVSSFSESMETESMPKKKVSYKSKKSSKRESDSESSSEDEIKSPSKSIDSTPTPTQEPTSVPDENKFDQMLSSFSMGESNSVEIVFSFDTTGSMSACLAQVRAKVSETVSRLMKDIPSIRIGIIAHGDFCDGKNAISILDLSDKVNDICTFVNTVGSTSGGDAPEAYELVLRDAKALSWSEKASKALVVIGDEVPHPLLIPHQRLIGLMNWMLCQIWE